MDDVERLVARHAVTDVVYRYCRGVDRLDRELVRSCYHPDATDEHGSFEGGVDAYLEWAFGLLERYDRTFHLVGNLLVEFHPDDDDLARVETYGVAHHRRAGGPERANLVTGFRFVDRFTRRPGTGWRIARRVAVTEWSRVDREEHWWPVPDHLRQGRRDPSDPVYDW